MEGERQGCEVFVCDAVYVLGERKRNKEERERERERYREKKERERDMKRINKLDRWMDG